MDLIGTSRVKWSGCSNGRRKSEKHVSCFDDTRYAFYIVCGRVRFSMTIISNKSIRLTSYDLYLKVPPMSDSCSRIIGSKGKSGEAASSKDLQVTSPEGPEPTTTTFIDLAENKRLRANDRSSSVD